MLHIRPNLSHLSQKLVIRTLKLMDATESPVPRLIFGANLRFSRVPGLLMRSVADWFPQHLCGTHKSTSETCDLHVLMIQVNNWEMRRVGQK